MSDGRTTSSMFRRSAGTSFPSGSYSPPEVVSDEGDNPPSVLFDGGGFQSPSSPARRPVRAPPKAQLRADHDLSGTPRCIPSETLGCRRGHSTRRTGIVLRAGVGRRRPDPPGPRYYLRRHRRAPEPSGGQTVGWALTEVVGAGPSCPRKANRERMLTGKCDFEKSHFAGSYRAVGQS